MAMGPNAIDEMERKMQQGQSHPENALGAAEAMQYEQGLYVGGADGRSLVGVPNGVNGRPPYSNRTAVGTQAAQDRITIEGAASGLENTLHDLGEAVEELEKVLQPFLRPTYPIPEGAKNGVEQSPVESPIAQQFWVSSGRVLNKARRIRDLIERIDL